MNVKVLSAMVLVVMPSFALADAPVEWGYDAQHRSLVGMKQEEEIDTAFHAECQSSSSVLIGIGAEPGIGKGDGARAVVRLSSISRSVQIEGRSRNSPNFEMTGGAELQATIPVTHPVFQVLADEGPITASGDLKATWSSAGRAAAVRKFIAACR